MATPEYDPNQPAQHAQYLFNFWREGPLADLYAWLRERNLDANVTPHAEILRLWRAHHENLAETGSPEQFPEPADHLKEA